MKKILYILVFCFIAISTHAQNYEHIVNYNFNGTPTNGVKIKTNIPFSNGVAMPTIKIQGFNYHQPGVADPSMLNLTLGCNVYNNVFYGTTISNAGGTAPSLWISNENGKIVIFIDQKIYYQRFTISAFAQGMSEKPEYFQGWTVVDEPKGGTVQTLVPYKNVFGGNVGIGTETPQYPLDVNGIINGAEVKTEVANLNYINLGLNTLSLSGLGFNRNAKTGTILNTSIPAWQFTSRPERFALEGYNGALNRLFAILPNGNFGIGTNNPDQKLTVKGKIHAEEVLIDLNVPLADYVFKQNYKLMPLNELEQFVQTNSHLPEIPSAEEVAEKGLSIGEMQNKLLQKIEELTLYIIDQNKEIKALKEENKEIKNQLKNK